MEATVLANATGFRVGRRGMYGPACKEVREMGEPCFLPNQMLSTGLVDLLWVQLRIRARL